MSSQAVGFANVFYTLWDVTVNPIYITDAYGKHWLVREDVHYNYIKNISKDMATAKSLYPHASFIEDLRGRTQSWISNGKENLSPELVQFGKYCGHTIHEIAVKDFGYLLWLRENARDFALRQAIEGMEVIKEHDARIASEKAAKMDGFIKLESGLHTVKFERNAYSITPESGYESWLAEIDKILLRTPNGYLGISEVDENTSLRIIFPNGKRVEGIYPYNMVEVNGKMTKLKNKEFQLNLNIEYTLVSENGVTQFATIKSEK